MLKTFCCAALVTGLCPEGVKGSPVWSRGVVLGVRGTPARLVVLVGGVGRNVEGVTVVTA